MQGIEFQIVNDSSGAASGLDKLTASLSKLKSGLGSSGTALSRTAKGIKDIKNTLSSMNTGDFENKLGRISRSLETLNTKAGSLKLSSSIGNQLTAIGTALNAMPDTTRDKLTALAEGLAPLSELGKSNLGSFTTQLEKLPAIMQQLDAMDMDKFADQMQRLSNAMAPFASQMQKVSTGFSSFPSRIQRLITSTNQYNGVVSRATNNTNMWGKALKTISLAAIFRGATSFLASAINKASEYQEDLNLFTVSMGEYAQEAYEYAQKVSEVVGIDPAEWMRNQGVFNSIITGFGVAGDKAAFMSKNLTQLGYDLSSFYNLDFASAMQKVQSGIAGELEPLRRLGYDLSVARLEQEALNLGITKSVSAMNQAEKAQLRYYAMMTQVTQVQGDMARTLENPANMLRILRAQLEQASRAIGNLFIPVLTKVLPIAIAVASALREIIAAIASLFGVELKEPVWDNAGGIGSSIGDAAEGADDIANSMGDAADDAKKLKQYLAGFDELNVMPPETEDTLSSALDGLEGIGSGDLGIELPGYDFLEGAVTNQIEEWKKKLEPFVNWVKDNLQEILDAAVGIGAAFIGWMLSNELINAVGRVREALSAIGGLKTSAGLLLLSGLFADINRFVGYFNDIAKNGANLSNVSGLIAEMSGIIGDFAALKGELAIGGAMKMIQGVGELVSACADISKNGINWDNVSVALTGISNLVIGLGFINKNWTAIGAGFTMQGIVTVISEVKNIIEACKSGNWDDVSWVTLAIGGIEAVGGIIVAIKDMKGTLNAAKGASSGLSGLRSVTDNLNGVTDALGDSSATGALDSIGKSTSTMTSKLSTLAKNMGLGILVMAEVAAGAIIFAGAVAVVGWELGKVADAWRPVIDNAGTVAIAVAAGAVLMAAIGAACYGLGTVGATAALSIGLGSVILAEIGIAAILFVAEIWAIGEGLNAVGEAWEPVIANGSAIAEAVAVGTALLVGIGTVTAALGAASVATGGLLPAAIMIGVGVLYELGIAFFALVDNLIVVADELDGELAPALKRVNGTLPSLKSDMGDFARFMGDFATKVSDYTKSMGKMTWSSIVGAFQKLFVGDPIGSMAEDISEIATDTAALNESLAVANRELGQAVVMLVDYSALMAQMQALSESNGTHDLQTGIYTNLKEVGSKLVTGFSDGMAAQTPYLKNTLTSIQNTVFNNNSAYSVGFSYGRSLANGIASAIRSTSFPTISGSLSTYGGTPSVRVRAYAEGGYVDEGQLFIAREAGAEMVGSIGRRTAVANNDQITEGVADAVFAALMETGILGYVKSIADSSERTAQKEFSLGKPSSAVGRWVSQSVEAYDAVRG